ncbi:MAG: amidohydrolase [Phycisphaerae bacterium]|nr:amidohydrolase [Phycisphaerae bacterium]
MTRNRAGRAAWTVFAASLLVAGGALAASDDRADRIWVGGPILTLNDAAPRARAIAVRDGRIVAVGAEADVLALRGPETVVANLDGKALLPGFVDAHGHMMMGGLQALSANLLPPPDGGVKDISSLQETLRAWIAANQAAVKEIGLIIGFGYDNAMLAELRHPTREDLDAVSKDIPVIVIHQSGHLYAVNSKALEITGVTAETPDPSGGVIRREADGKTPNGVLEETAGFPVLIKLLSRIGSERAPQFVVAGADLWARYGYTTAQEARSVPAVTKTIRRVADAGKLKLDVVIYPDVLVARDEIRADVRPTYENHVRVAGAKLTIDGSGQGFTAWRDRPYYQPVGNYPPGYAGYAAAKPEEVRDAIDWAFANDIQIITHCNGEAASDLLIACVGDAIAKHGAKDTRPVLIHGQFLREDQVDSLRRLDIIPSLFPMHTYYWGDWHREHTVGPQLADNISPTGWCVARGMRFTTHHDAPVAFPDSMRVLDATVTRRTRTEDILGPAQRVDVVTALKAMTIWPAYQIHEEATKGSLEVGKRADFVVLSKDPTAVDPETLDQIKVVETIKDGTTIFVLTPAEERRAALMARPSASGDNAFERFLIATATRRDFEALPPEIRLRPMVRQAFEASRAGAPHEKACVLRAMDEVIAAVVASSQEEPPKLQR